MRKIILTLTIVCAVITLLSIVNDPFFGIPFQDWDQMPKEQQNTYIERSADMKRMKNIFGICTIIGATYLFISMVLKKRK